MWHCVTSEVACGPGKEPPSSAASVIPPPAASLRSGFFGGIRLSITLSSVLQPLSDWLAGTEGLVRSSASSRVSSSISSANGLGGGTLGLYHNPRWLETDLDRGEGTGAGAGGSCVQGPGWTMVIHGWLVLTLGLPLVGLVLQGESGQDNVVDNEEWKSSSEDNCYNYTTITLNCPFLSSGPLNCGNYR